MKNLLSFCGLDDVRITCSLKGLPMKGLLKLMQSLLMKDLVFKGILMKVLLLKGLVLKGLILKGILIKILHSRSIRSFLSLVYIIIPSSFNNVLDTFSLIRTAKNSYKPCIFFQLQQWRFFFRKL